MKKKLKIFLLAILTSSGYLIKLNAQIIPNLDSNYELVTAKSDEFNGTALDVTLWSKLPTTTTWGYFGGIGYGRSDLGRYVSCSHNNVIENGGYLRLQLTGTNPTYFYMGQIESKNPDYSYGYFEISAKLVSPGYYNSSGQLILSGIWPAFWLYYLIKDCSCYHDEIDILDNLYGDYACGHNLYGVTPSEDLKYVVGGTGSKLPNSTDPGFTSCIDISEEYVYKNSSPLFENEHKYGVEWLSNKIFFYLDGNLVGVNSGVAVPQHPLYVVLGMQMNSGYVDINMPLPQEYQVNYFRYYKLIEDYCGTDASIQNNTQLNSFVFGVRRNITIGTGTSSISLSGGVIKTFRATNEITLNGDFTVPLGAELNLIPTPCN